MIRRKIKQAAAHIVMKPHIVNIRYCAAGPQHWPRMVHSQSMQPLHNMQAVCRAMDVTLDAGQDADGQMMVTWGNDTNQKPWVNKSDLIFFCCCWSGFCFKLLWTLSIPRRLAILIYVAHLFFISHSCTSLLYIFQPALVKRRLRLYGLKHFFFSISLLFTLDLH